MILRAENLTRDYTQGRETIQVLKSLTLELDEGETLAILGQSGSGKSTFLSLLSGLDRPTSGRVLIAGQDLSLLSEDELIRFRASRIGIVFQQFHLMSNLTAEENVALPLEISRAPGALDQARALLEEVGLGHRMEHLPAELSGGEKQRVAIARSMITQPALLLADEPSGNLDAKTGQQVMELLFRVAEARKASMILVTHNEELASRCGRLLHLVDGKLQE